MWRYCIDGIYQKESTKIHITVKPNRRMKECTAKYLNENTHKQHVVELFLLFFESDFYSFSDFHAQSNSICVCVCVRANVNNPLELRKHQTCMDVHKRFSHLDSFISFVLNEYKHTKQHAYQNCTIDKIYANVT